ncbi:MAG: bacteriochlorophyll 4-vinyl reductase [Marivita sp.]|uniref:bacteriochlorophyll 4-vinyl reductase n=1 Tax=Marivita sp. TaxID=2003365 RepID=UPI003EFB078B
MQQGAVIGPNAILQLLPQIARIGGEARVAQMLAEAGVFEVPDGTQMIPEGDAMRLHQVLRRDEPDMAPELASEAGRATADYILAHRIPKPAQLVLKALPAPLAARVLSGAIAKHAWTFAGSGVFRVLSPWCFEIAQNPIVRGEHSATPLCHWHAAVFARLYQVLVHKRVTCFEASCCAVSNAEACRFVLRIS